MSLKSKLQDFIENSQETTEAQFLQSLRNFLETTLSELPVVESLKKQLNIWESGAKSDQEILDSLLRFVTDRTETPFTAEKFMRSKPTLQDFERLSPSQLKACLEFDRSQRTYHDKIVYNVNKTESNTEFVIWLLGQGFEGCSFDTPSICENNNFRLLQFYHENKVCGHINCHALGTVVKNNNVSFFRYILQNNLFDSGFLGKKISFNIILENCIMFNRLEMMKELFAKEPNMCKECVLDMYNQRQQLNPMAKASNPMCLWLWENGMKWTHSQAKNIGNAFMMSFFG